MSWGCTNKNQFVDVIPDFSDGKPTVYVDNKKISDRTRNSLIFYVDGKTTVVFKINTRKVVQSKTANCIHMNNEFHCSIILDQVGQLYFVIGSNDPCILLSKYRICMNQQLRQQYIAGLQDVSFSDPNRLNAELLRNIIRAETTFLSYNDYKISDNVRDITLLVHKLKLRLSIDHPFLISSLISGNFKSTPTGNGLEFSKVECLPFNELECINNARKAGTKPVQNQIA